MAANIKQMAAAVIANANITFIKCLDLVILLIDVIFDGFKKAGVKKDGSI